MDKSGILKYILYMNSTFNIVFKDDLMQIFTSISEAFDMRMSVMDLDKKEISPLQFQPICSYCSLIQKDLGLLESCRKNDAKYCSEALKKGTAVSYTCHAGLREAIFPIIIDKEAIGFFIVGQFSTRSAIPSSVLKKTKSPDEQNKLKKAFSEVTSHKEERLKSIIKLLEITTQYVIDKRILSIKRNLLTDKVHEYLMKDLSSNPTAEETAAAVNMSTSSINKALKQIKGISFRQYSNEIRLETARIYLEKDPQMTVSEAALKVGIEDPLYFSRIFKRRFGIPPKMVKQKNKECSVS